MIRSISGFETALTTDIVDETFPLQSPNGVASLMKAALDRGEQDTAEAIYKDLRAADHGTVEHMADELLVKHALPVTDLAVLRALRLGIQAGIQHGRQEGAQVVEEIMSFRGEQ